MKTLSGVSYDIDREFTFGLWFYVDWGEVLPIYMLQVNGIVALQIDITPTKDIIFYSDN